MSTSVEEIFAEMIERRPLLSPISSLRPPRQSPGSSRRRVRFAPSPVSKSRPFVYDDLVVATPRPRLRQLKWRFYRTPGQVGSHVPTVRLWRMKPGLYEFVCCDESTSALPILRKVKSSNHMRVRLPRGMIRPESATHLQIGKPGEDQQYPKGKAEWVRR